MRKIISILKRKYLLIGILILFLIINLKAEEIETMNTLTVHYHRYDKKYDGWSLWTWLDHKTVEIFPKDQDEFGKIFILNIDEYPAKGNINILPRFTDWKDKDTPERTWSRSMTNEIWILQGHKEIFTSQPEIKPFIRKAFIDTPNKLTVLLTNPVDKSQLKKLSPKVILKNKKTVKAIQTKLIQENSTTSIILELEFLENFDLKQLPAKLYIKGFIESNLYIRGILDSMQYTTDKPLGTFYTPKETKFVVYAPGATEIILNIYDDPISNDKKTYFMEKADLCTWELSIKKNLKNKYYTFQVDGPDPNYNKNIEIIEPYCKCTTAHNGRGIISNDKTSITKSPTFPFSDAVIYEMHVRDFTIAENSGVKNKGKYLGFTETGTTVPGTDLSTGLDHLVELGVNTLQLMPIQDFEHENDVNNYFWGYMPVNFNAPDGWYATDQYNCSGISEFKQLVDACHKKGIKVILDVVYNHTAEGNSHIKYNFNGFVPNFYYRTKLNNSYWNGSGCGNEIRSENIMVRKFIIESLKYWVEEFKIDGFRFDLMGLHDMKTMEEIVYTLKNIKQDIFIYGEPWTAGDTPIIPTVKGTQRSKNFSVFNDNFRDALKGPWYDLTPGYIQTGKYVDGVKKGIIGSIDDFADSPSEVINYVVCHDGRTLWDRIVATTEDSSFYNDSELKAMDKLAAAILFTSQGTPFMHGGQEILRTKFGSHNSYNQPDKINKIRWDYKQENLDIFKYYQGLIKLRNEHPMFRMKHAFDIRKNIQFFEDLGFNVPTNCIAYKINRGKYDDTWREVIILINPNQQPIKFNIPDKKWILVVNSTTAGTEIITPVSSTEIELDPISVQVMYRP